MKLDNPQLLREQCFIAGEWVGSASIEVINPATDKKLGQVPSLERQAVEDAIAAAAKAFDSWRCVSAQERGNYLYRWYELLQAHREDLARIDRKSVV